MCGVPSNPAEQTPERIPFLGGLNFEVILKLPQAVFEVRRKLRVVESFLNRDFKEFLCYEFLNFGCHTGLIELDDFGELSLLFFQECVDLSEDFINPWSHRG